MKKGVSLPIQTIVLLTISAVVVVVLLIVFVSSVGSKTSEQEILAFISSNCAELRYSQNCGLDACDEGKSPEDLISQIGMRAIKYGGRMMTLAEACRLKKGITGASDAEVVAQCCMCGSVPQCAS